MVSLNIGMVIKGRKRFLFGMLLRLALPRSHEVTMQSFQKLRPRILKLVL